MRSDLEGRFFLHPTSPNKATFSAVKLVPSFPTIIFCPKPFEENLFHPGSLIFFPDILVLILECESTSPVRTGPDRTR